MWDWEDEQDVTVKPVWIKALTPDGTFIPTRVELKSKNIEQMRLVAHQEPDGSRPYMTEVQKEPDGRRHPQTRYFRVKRQRNGVWMDLDVAVNPHKQTLTCTCLSGSISYLHPCIDGGGAMIVMEVLHTQEDYYTAGKSPPGEASQPTTPAHPANASQPNPEKPVPPLSRSKPTQSSIVEGPRVTLEDLKLGTTDLAVGMLVDLQPIYFDPKRIDGAILVEAPGFKVTAFGNATVVRNFTSDIIKPRLDAISGSVPPALPLQPPTPMTPPLVRLPPTPQTPVVPTATAEASAAAPLPARTEGDDDPDPDEETWCNAATAAEFLIAAYDVAEAKGIQAASTTTELIAGMYSLVAPIGHLEDPKAYRQQIYELTREERRADRSIRPSQVARAVEVLRPDLVYWNSKKWEGARTEAIEDKHATEVRKSLKVGCAGQHWLAPREEA